MEVIFYLMNHETSFETGGPSKKKWKQVVSVRTYLDTVALIVEVYPGPIEGLVYIFEVVPSSGSEKPL